MKNWKTVWLTTVVVIACVVCVAFKPVAPKTYRFIQVQRKNNVGPEVEKVINDAAKDGWELVLVHTEENKVVDFVMAK
jgi:hypothetical protein